MSTVRTCQPYRQSDWRWHCSFCPMIAIFLGITPRLKRNIFVFKFIVVTKLCSSCNKRKVVLPDVMCKMSEILEISDM